MKKIILGLVVIAGCLSACHKEEYNPTLGNTDERLAAKLAEYKKDMVGAQFGWKAYLLPASGGVASFVFNFTDDGRVKMISDINAQTSTVYKESSYRLKALQRPTLLFDTYTYIHLLSDPNPNVLGGATGEGYSADFEFAFLSASPDTIKFEGTFNKNKLILVRAAAKAETDNFMSDLSAIGTTFNKLLTYWKRVNLNGVDYELVLNTSANTIGFNYLENGELKSFSSVYYIDGSKIVLITPFIHDKDIVTSISGITFNTGVNAIDAVMASKSVQIKESAVPLKTDLAAPQNWYNQMFANFNGCWVSDKAFHVNGIDDFCNFKAITGFQNLWYAGPAVFGGTSEGLITFTGSLTSPYCLSKTPFTVNAGIARFTLLTNVGTFTGTGAQAIAMTSARNILYGGAVAGTNFQDWYFVQTAKDGLHYDMVRASDAKAWISWRPR